MPETLVLGAVAYDPKVVTIWDGFRAWLREQHLDLDYVLYSNYERQVVDLVAGRIDVAWNSPLAWVRARRMSEAAGFTVTPLVMRDTDRDLTSVVVVRADAEVADVGDLAGCRVAVGAVDSPQATLLPLGLFDGVGVEVVRFDVGVGLHGDHVGGERDAARALIAGEVDAACMIDANHLAFTTEGTLPSGATRIVARTARYDHCNLTVGPGAGRGADRLGALLRSMSYEDASVRHLLDLEGLTRWVEGRTSHYAALEAAVDRAGFYGAAGEVTAPDYRP